jgi:hypothetical protein
VKLHTVRAHVRRSPTPPAAYAQKHRALIAFVRQRRARAAQERFDAAMERMAADIADALEQALRGEQ